MRKTAALLFAAATLAAPAAALAAPPTPGHPHHARRVARQTCTTERQGLGVTAFRQKYGAPNALGHCVKSHLPADRRAAAQCRTERKQIGAPAFRLKYGAPAPLNRCVSKLTTP